MIPIAKPSLGDAEARAAAAAIRSGWVSQGPEVAAFEQEFAALVGARHACCVSSCTAALHIALHSLGVTAGDEVITVSHSFIAASNIIRLCGAEPVFVDIDPGSYNIAPDLIENAITPRTKLILPAHQMGVPCELRRILDIADQHGLPVVEDAACAVGSRYHSGGRWQNIGRPHGRIACFSFHPRKVVTTGEGGMLTTNDSELDQRFRLLRQHGMSVSDLYRHQAKQIVFEQYLETGFNYRMSDMQAAVGRVQLTRLPELLQKRRAQAHRYDQALATIPGLQPLKLPPNVQSNYQSYPVYVDGAFPMDRDQLMQALLQHGISTRRGIMNAHQEPAYAGYKHPHPPLPVSEAARDQVLLLPIYADLGQDDQDRIIEVLANLAQKKRSGTSR